MMQATLIRAIKTPLSTIENDGISACVKLSNV
jgi:hypothetical protein